MFRERSTPSAVTTATGARVVVGDAVVEVREDDERLVFSVSEATFASEAARLLEDTPLVPLVDELGGWARVGRVERDWGEGSTFSVHLDRDPARSPWDDGDLVAAWASANGWTDEGGGMFAGSTALGPAVVQFSSERLSAEGGTMEPNGCAPR
ncbi:MAG: hypothetical protein KC621_29145 [Myxococcales bacterium]|nr:hypothetical protein [Myxococcales bacterium]